MKAGILVLAAFSALAPAPPGAQTPDDVARKEDELVAVWERTPLDIRRAVFVTERPQIYGAYQERGSNVFKAGETLLTYVEPVGFTWTRDGEVYKFGVTIDFLLKSADGKVLGGQDRFMEFSRTSRNRVRELMVNIDLNVSGAPAGTYVVEYKLHDIGNGRTASVAQTFQIVE